MLLTIPREGCSEVQKVLAIPRCFSDCGRIRGGRVLSGSGAGSNGRTRGAGQGGRGTDRHGARGTDHGAHRCADRCPDHGARGTDRGGSSGRNQTRGRGNHCSGFGSSRRNPGDPSSSGGAFHRLHQLPCNWR